jgi:hypothetical protein
MDNFKFPSVYEESTAFCRNGETLPFPYIYHNFLFNTPSLPPRVHSLDVFITNMEALRCLERGKLFTHRTAATPLGETHISQLTSIIILYHIIT